MVLLLRNVCVQTRTLLFQCTLKHKTDEHYCHSRRNYIHKRTFPRGIQDHRLGVFCLNLITRNRHNTNFLALKSCFNARTIGNQKKQQQMIQMNSAPALCSEYISWCYTYLSRHLRKPHLLNGCLCGHAVQSKTRNKKHKKCKKM